MESKRQEAPGVLMLPHPGHGHVTAFYELAKKLSNKGFPVYFCSTPVSLEPIRNNHFPNIQLIDLELPSSFHQELLPPHYHSTKHLPPHLKNTLVAAFDASKPAFSDILKTWRPNLVIYDMFQPWAAQAARELNIEAVLFISAAVRNITFEIPEETESNWFKDIVSGMTYMQRFYQSVSSSPNMVLVRTSREIQAKYYNDGKPSSSVLGPLVPVGHLVQRPQDHDDNDKIIDWLSKKEASSVVFVAFGSEYFLSEEEMEEMAKGLELSRVDFIWVVRFHGGKHHTSVDEVLPQGFLERTNGRGLVVEWAPQSKILAHASTGGFVSHCGWSSTIESMVYGVPIIAVPMNMGVDQPGNAKLVVEMGVGMEVPRHNKKLVREEVGRVIRRVVVEEEGKEMKKRATELSESLKKTDDEEFDEAVKKLVQLVQE